MRHAMWLFAALATLGALGCGSIRPSVLFASARAEYPDCDDVHIAERADGVRQWMVICGERRLFGLGSEASVRAATRARRDLRDDEVTEALLHDHSPPIQWSAPQRVDDRSISSVVAWLRPLRVEVTMLGVDDGSAYFSLESPHHAGCTRPELRVANERHELGSAPTETVIESRHRFAQRIDPATLALLASEPFEIAYCGQSHALDAETAVAFRAWAAERVADARVASPASLP